MTSVLLYVDPEPLLIGLLLVTMLLASECGYRIGRPRGTRTAGGTISQVNVIVAATLGLLALLVGFSLSMAVSRDDARRHSGARARRAVPGRIARPRHVLRRYQRV